MHNIHVFRYSFHFSPKLFLRKVSGKGERDGQVRYFRRQSNEQIKPQCQTAAYYPSNGALGIIRLHPEYQTTHERTWIRTKNRQNMNQKCTALYIASQNFKYSPSYSSTTFVNFIGEPKCPLFKSNVHLVRPGVRYRGGVTTWGRDEPDFKHINHRRCSISH